MFDKIKQPPSPSPLNMTERVGLAAKSGQDQTIQLAASVISGQHNVIETLHYLITPLSLSLSLSLCFNNKREKQFSRISRICY